MLGQPEWYTGHPPIPPNSPKSANCRARQVCPRVPIYGWLPYHLSSPLREERPMPCQSLLALPVLGACVLSLLTSASPYASSAPARAAAPMASPPQGPGVADPPPVPEAN